MSDLLKNLTKIYVAQISSAMIISEILTDHSNETQMTPDLLIAGLVYRLMTPMTTEEINDNLESATDVIEDIFEDTGSESGSESDEEEVILERTPRKIKMNTCNCEICSQARVCILNYYTHQCPDKLSEKFKDSITHTCQKHNLII